MSDKQPRLFTLWLDASDGSIASHDGVQWPDGTADVRHRYRRSDGIQWSPESLAETIHGKLARIEWAPDVEAERDDCLESLRKAAVREREQAVRINAIRRARGRAEATLAAVREYLETSDDDGIRTREHLLGLLDQAGVLSASAAEVPSSADLGEALGFALAAMLPGAEPVFCHHENASRSQRTTAQAGWGYHTVYTVTCPACPAWAESLHGYEMPAPWLLNEARCTEACAERHTNRPGCLMQPVRPRSVARPDRTERPGPPS